MVMMKASFVVAVPLALGLVAAVASKASAQTDPHVGTWKLNLAKSKYSPGPPHKEVTVITEAAGPNMTTFVQGADAEGKPINPAKNKVNVILDGKEHPNPNPAYDTIVFRRIDANGYESINKKAGKVVTTPTHVVSKDGKTNIVTTKGTNTKGETINNVMVFDRQ